MGRRPEPVPEGPLKEFAVGLRALRADSGMTLRQLAQRAHFSLATLSAAAAGQRLPTREVTLAFVRACGGDQEEWSQRWADLQVLLKATDPGLLAPENRAGDEKTGIRSAMPTQDSGGYRPPLITPWVRSAPRRIGRYRVLGTLNRGGVADVHLAADRSGEPLAVKILSAQGVVPDKETGGKSSDLRRFEEEVDAMRTVRARNMPALIAADTRAKQPWVATRFLPGPTVAHAVERTGALPEQFVLALASGVAEALVDLHAAGLVHRDLKPANVLLTAQSPQVIDLGIVRAAQRRTMTVRDGRVGTLAFMAPEQADGKKVTAAADIFALGCLLAYAATGVEPFGGGDNSDASTLYRIVHGDPDEKALACENKQLRALIEGCLAKDPAHRPTAAQVLETSGSARSETGWSLPRAVGAVAERYEAQARALLDRAARRRRAVRRVGAATATVVLILGGTAAGALLEGDRHVPAPRTSGPLTPTGHSGRGPATPAQVTTRQAADPSAAPSATSAASRANPAPSGPITLTPGPSTPPSAQLRYAFDCATDGWARVSGDAMVGFSTAQHHNGACSLTIHDTSLGTVPAVAAVAGLSNGPAAGTPIAAWIYYAPRDSGPSVRAALYVTDSRSQQHIASFVTVSPSNWYHLSYIPAGYSGAATSLGLQFTKSGTADITVYLDEVAW